MQLFPQIIVNRPQRWTHAHTNSMAVFAAVTIRYLLAPTVGEGGAP